MSSIDILHVSALLQSKKIKDRNDALTELDLFTQSQTPVTTKVLKHLVNSLTILIEIELSLYSLKPTPAIENRLSLASLCLRVIVAKTSNVKSKILIDLIKTVIYLSIPPCLTDFVITIDKILQIQYVTDHLSAENHLEFSKFLIKTINLSLDNNQFDKLTISAFSSLFSLTNHMHIYKNYRSFIFVLQRTVSLLSRENLVCLFCVRIINKLVILLSTEDIKATHSLIVIGIDLLSKYTSSKSLLLQDQFLSFINLKPVLKFAGSKNYGIVEKNKALVNALEGISDDFLNKISAIIQQLISKLNTTKFEFNYNDFELFNNFNSKRSWFDLKSIRLLGFNHNPWLLSLGIVNLLKVYYDLKPEHNNLLEFGLKRQKLNTISDALNGSQGIQEFLVKLVTTKFELKTQKAGLQLMLFYFQSTSGKSDPESETNNISFSAAETSFNFNELPNFSINSVLKLVLTTFEQVDLHFWSLMVSQVLILDIVTCGNSVTNQILYQLFTISIQAVKFPDLSIAACSLIYTLVQCMERKNLFRLIDKSISNQIDNLVELPDVNGPLGITNITLSFWYSIYKIIKNDNLKARTDYFPTALQKWFVSKWERGFSDTYVSQMPEFISWICGLTTFSIENECVHARPPYKRRPIEYNLLLFEQKDEYFSYLTFEDHNYQEFNTTFQIGNLKQCKETESFLLFILQRVSSNLSSNQNLLNKIEELIAILIFCTKFLNCSIYSHLVEPFKNQIKLFFESSAVHDLLVEVKIEIIRVFNVIQACTDLESVGWIISIVPIQQYCKEIVQLSGLESIKNEVPFSPLESLAEFGTTYYSSHLTSRDFSNPIAEAIACSVNCYSLEGKPLSAIVPLLILRLDDVPVNVLVASVVGLIDEVISMPLIDFSATSKVQLIRLLGDNLLTVHKFERSELIFVSICKLLRYLSQTLQNEPDLGYCKDVYDMTSWIVECDALSMITTEMGDLECCAFLVAFTEVNDGLVITNDRLKSLILKRISCSTNFVRTALARHYTKMARSLDSREQIEYYRAIIQRYPQPNSGIENGASFVYFVCHLCQISPKIHNLVIFNLLECSIYPTLSNYLVRGLELICKIEGFSITLDLFNSIKLSLLKWWLQNNDFFKFPYKLFGYITQEEFIIKNYRIIAALAMSMNLLEEVALLVLLKIANLRHSDPETICSESFSLAIPLAFTDRSKKNSFFDELPKYLGTNYNTDFVQKLLMIVLDIILLTDISREAEALKLFRGNAIATQILSTINSEVRGSSDRVDLPLATSMQLLLKFIQKYHKEGEFWNVQNTFILLRRMFVVLQNSISISDKLVCLRKVKLVLIFGSAHINAFTVSKLTIESLSPLVLIPELSHDVLTILNCLRVDKLLEFGALGSYPLVIQLLAWIIYTSTVLEYPKLLKSINDYTSNLPSSNKLKKILFAALAIIENSDLTLTSKDVEDFLEDSQIFPYCSVSDSYDLIMSLISFVFTSIVVLDSSNISEVVASILFDATSATQQGFSTKFELWRSKILAEFYLEGGLAQNNCKIQKKLEFANINLENFPESIKYLDYALKIMVQFCGNSDSIIAGCGENVLGVFLFKYSTNKSEFRKYLNFDYYFEKYSEYILPIDIHTCVVLNDTFELEYVGANLTDILDDLEHFVSGNKFEVWTSSLLLALLQEIGYYTNVASLFSCFTRCVRSYASKVLPFFVSFYINLLGLSGCRFAEKLFCELLKIKSINEETVEFSLQTILLIRIGSKLGLSPFQKVFSSIDLHKFYNLAFESKQPKTALLIFEEIYCNGKTILNWGEESGALGEVYESLNDIDLIHGIPESTSVEYALSMINRGENTSNQLKFSNALIDANATLKTSATAATFDDNKVINSLSNNGLIGLSRIVSDSLGCSMNEQSYEWAWKLNLWDLPIPSKLSDGLGIIYSTLKQVNDNPLDAMNICESTLMSLLKIKEERFVTSSTSKEHFDEVQNWFQLTAVIHSLIDILSYNESQFRPQVQIFLGKTSWFESSSTSNSENILLARHSLYHILSDFQLDLSKLSSGNIWLGALNELIRYNISSQNSGQQQKVVSSSLLINEISKRKFSGELNLLENVKELARYYVARSIWTQGVTDTPIAMLKDLTAKGSIELPLEKLSIDKSLLNATLVGWMSLSRQDIASNIMENYVLPTADVTNSLKSLNQMAKVYHLLANFCEKQYKSRVLNDEINDLENRLKSKRLELEKVRAFYLKATVDAETKRQAIRDFAQLKAQRNSADLDLKALIANKQRFSMKAVEFYLKSISIVEDDDEDEDVDKFFALWLEMSANNELNKTLSTSILSLPSYKLISWSIQMISRLSNEKTEFQYVLQQLVQKICKDHPYHTLYQLLSLKIHKNYMDDTNDDYKLSKYNAAAELWQKILADPSNSNRHILALVEKFSQETLNLAEHKASRNKTLLLSRLNVGKYWLNELPSIPLPTMTLPIDKTLKYNNVPTINRVESQVKIAATGLSLPKILTFHLSNGEEHLMLAKHGSDDLRQDSIMEQVFEKVNHMLWRDKETRKRSLHIRTYKAVPMGPKAGMLEFVPKSISLMDVIKPYHVKYDTMTIERARELMKGCERGEKQPRFDAYNEITEGIKPVLRHFFFDNFLTPDTWFESRLIYTHGVATTSIVGHMLGLGDRHCNNILLDQRSGEPIHIDLGVAFDQGKTLTVPETVPFRLTRDMVDGFGVTGTSGVFRKSSEHTFRVLRANTEHILSILDVLRWDPLFSWNISMLKQQRLQNETGDIGNIVEDGSEAGRAVLTVSDKLAAGGLNVDAAVRELIQEATNPRNLALLYFGWSPFY